MSIQENVHYDRIYGQIPYTDDDMLIYQTPEMTRLRHLSLSAVPTYIKKTNLCAHKFEHTVAVAYLARIVGEKPEFADIAQDLYFAALAHDLGTPPFSHTSEIFQKTILDKNHEEFVGDILEGSEFADEITRQGGDLKRVFALVTGELSPISDLMNGTIDIDNLDNSLRYGLSQGVISDVLYDPTELAKNYTLMNNQIGFQQGSEDLLAAWEEARKTVYTHVYSQGNLVGSASLHRALAFAVEHDELDRDYFLMTDAEAWLFLRNQCNPLTSQLICKMERWQLHECVYEFETLAPNPDLESLAAEPAERIKFADKLSAEFSLPREDIAVFADKNRGFREIHLPIFTAGGQLKKHASKHQASWLIHVYLAPEQNEKAVLIQDRMKEQFES